VRASLRFPHAALRRVRAGLASLAAALNLETDPARIARLVSSEAATLFRSDVVALLLPERDGLVVRGDHGLSAEGLRLPLGDETQVLVQAFRDGTVAYENDIAESLLGTGPLGQELGLKAALALPLTGRDGRIGCLLLGDTQYPRGDKQFAAR